MRTPYFVVDEAALRRNLSLLRQVAQQAGCKILLAQKAFSMFACYPLISRYLAFTPETEDLREINIYDPVRGYPVPIVGELGDGVILQMPYYNGSDISSFDRYRFKYCSWQDFMNSQLPE